MKEIIEIINTIDTSKANVNPTQIYNEGWMTRLLVYYSIKEKIKLKEIDFSTIKNWTSEALLHSPFVGVPKIKEGYTHTDIALGDFEVNYEKSGQIKVNSEANQFGVIESKMKSRLSKGTRHAGDYNQAIRNITCIAHNAPMNCKTFFYVVLPESKQNRAGFKVSHFVEDNLIIPKIKKRFTDHNTENKVDLDTSDIINKVVKCDVDNITYEEWIDLFEDEQIKETLDNFYKNCVKWNKL